MVNLRSAHELTTETRPKRPYIRKAAVVVAELQAELAVAEPEQEYPALFLDQSLEPEPESNEVNESSEEEENIPLARLVQLRKRVATTEINESSDEETFAPQRKKRKAPLKYTLVEDDFETLTDIDTYLRLHNQYHLNITNNETRKCTFANCIYTNKADRHMTCIFKKCCCGQDNCTLRYDY